MQAINSNLPEHPSECSEGSRNLECRQCLIEGAHAPQRVSKVKGEIDRKAGEAHRSARDSQMDSRLPGAGGGAAPGMVP